MIDILKRYEELLNKDYLTHNEYSRLLRLRSIIKTLKQRNSKMTISQAAFFELPEVLETIEVQKKNPFGSTAHRNAHIKMLEIAEQHSVVEFFESLKDYDRVDTDLKLFTY